MNSAPASSQQDVSRSYQRSAIRPEMTVRQVAMDYPACREVFVAYGEPTDRPGRFGHFQPVTHFARSHHISLDHLLEELSEAAGVPVDRWSKAAERVHRLFIASALVITLTLGAGWGAWLLWTIGVRRSFDAASVAQVVAHGEAQLWGFIGLFIVGVSLRTVLVDAVRTRFRQRMSLVLLMLVLFSLAAGFAWSLSPSRLLAIGLASALTLLVLSLVLWSVQLRLLWSKRRTPWARAVMTSGLWLTIWAAATCGLRWHAGAAGPGTYSMAERNMLIELAVFGFAMNSIYGFGQMLLPGFVRTGRPRVWAVEAAFWLHNVGVGLSVGGSAGIVPKWGAFAGIVLLAAGAVFYVVGQHLFIGKPRTSHSPEKGHRLLDVYIPLAFFWLVVSLLSLAGGAVEEVVTGAALPHAFIGAVRHALTVGFMTTLILGVGQRLLPVLERTTLQRPEWVAPILILIATGNLLRVTGELATLATPSAYAWMPISAVLEWTALLLFSLSIGSLMWRPDAIITSGRVTETSSLAILLAEHPWIEDHLIKRGSDYLMRSRSVPSELTIASFAQSEGQQPHEFVSDVNNLLASRGQGQVGHDSA